MSATLSDLTLAIIGGTGKTGKWAIKAALDRGANVRVLCRTPDKLKTVIYATLWKDGVIPDQFSYDKVVETGQLVVIKGSLPTGGKGEKIDGNTKFTVTDDQINTLKELIGGATHVMSFLGMDPNNKLPVCFPGIQALMRATSDLGSGGGGPKPKIVIMSSIVLSDSYAQGKAAWGFFGGVGWLMRKKILKSCFDDMEVAEQYGFENREKMGLDVTFLRATVLADKTGYYLDYSDVEAKKYYIAKSDELKKVKMNIDRQHVVQCFMDAVADKESQHFGSNCEWSLFDA